jgi:hypothetical protein
MTDELRGLDAWIEGRHITWDPRSPYYTGPECTCDDTDDPDCPACNPQDDEPDPDRYRDEERFDDEPDWAVDEYDR